MSFSQRIRPHVDAELAAARAAQADGDPAAAFTHLERAHVLGQASTVAHVRVHAQMAAWAWRQRDLREGLGQMLRLVGAATKTVWGLVPQGNTGGSNVSPIRSMPIAPDLAARIRQAQDPAGQ